MLAVVRQGPCGCVENDILGEGNSLGLSRYVDGPCSFDTKDILSTMLWCPCPCGAIRTAGESSLRLPVLQDARGNVDSKIPYDASSLVPMVSASLLKCRPRCCRGWMVMELRRSSRTACLSEVRDLWSGVLQFPVSQPSLLRWPLCVTVHQPRCGVKASLKLTGLLRIGYLSIILATISTGVLARCIVVGFDLERDPTTVSDFELSTSLRLARSTDRLKCARKSAPRMGFWTSATMKIQLNCRRRFKLSCRDFWPNVFMTVLFAAWRV